MNLDEAVNRAKVLSTALRLRAVELLNGKDACRLPHEMRDVAGAEKDAEALERLTELAEDRLREIEHDRRHRRA